MTDRPFADGFAVWRAAGWMGTLHLPRRRKAAPPDDYTGWDNPDPDERTVQSWRRQHPGGNLAIRLPEGVVGIDVDHYDQKRGADSLAQLEQLHGPLPVTYISTSRPSPSGIRLYRIPLGIRFHGLPVINGRSVDGIEFIQRGHRYLCAWPSVHPSGSRYQLLGPGGNVLDAPPRPEELPELPAAWVQGQRKDRPQVVHSAPLGATAFGARHKVVDQALDRALANMVRGGRHDAATKGVMALLNLRETGWPGADDALNDLRATFVRVVTGDGSRRDAEAEAEFKRMVDGGEELLRRSPPDGKRYEPPRPQRPPPSAFDGANARVIGLVVESDDEEEQTETEHEDGGLDAPAVNLPQSFWDELPVLRHIRRAAYARCVAPDALLHGVLATASAVISHRITLPPLVGKPGTLNYFTAIIGISGTGKSSAMSVAADVLRDMLDDADGAILEAPPKLGLPIGTGEGIAEKYMGEIETTNEDGEKVKVRGQALYNILFQTDEGEALEELMARKGSTLMETLRRGWTGDTLGQTNATKDRDRSIPAGNYRLALMVGFQTKKAAFLLADHDGGTPQRFSWASASDPATPSERVEWPGPWPWRSPHTHTTAAPYLVPDERPFRYEIRVAESIVAEIHAERVRIQRIPLGQVDELDPDGLNSHARYARLKIAALLALLDDQRMEVTENDWRLAGIVWDTSCTVREVLVSIARAERSAQEQAALRFHAEREAVGEMARRRAMPKVEQLARRLARKLHEDPTYAGQTLTRAKLGRFLDSKERKLDLLGDAISFAIEKGWLHETEDGYSAGDSRPS